MLLHGCEPWPRMTKGNETKLDTFKAIGLCVRPMKKCAGEQPLGIIPSLRKRRCHVWQMPLNIKDSSFETKHAF